MTYFNQRRKREHHEGWDDNGSYEAQALPPLRAVQPRQRTRTLPSTESDSRCSSRGSQQGLHKHGSTRACARDYCAERLCASAVHSSLCALRQHSCGGQLRFVAKDFTLTTPRRTCSFALADIVEEGTRQANPQTLNFRTVLLPNGSTINVSFVNEYNRHSYMPWVPARQ